MSHKISVIIPVYNVEKYVGECIQSVLNQTFKNLEILVIDDGSTDASLKIIKKFNDERIKVIIKENGGVSSARNIGINHASGEYIYFMDSDDFIINSAALEDMYRLSVENDSDIVVGNAVQYYDNENFYPIYRNKEFFFERTITSEEFYISALKTGSMYAGIWFNLYRSSLIKNKIAFYEGINYEDEDFIPRVFLSANRVSIYDNNFYAYRQRLGSITKTVQDDNAYNNIMTVCIESHDFINKIKNQKLKRLILDNYVTLLLSACYMNRVNKIKKSTYIFLLKNSYTFKTFCKTTLFIVNKHLYYYINDLKKKTM